MEYPRADADLIRRLNRPEIEATAHRLRCMSRFMPEAAPAEVHRFGGATALVCPALPDLGFYNVVWHLAEANLPQLGQILDLYRKRGIRAHIHGFPGLLGREAAAAMAAEGLVPGGWMSLLYRPVDPPPPTVEGVTLRIVDAESADTFANVFMEGFGFREEDRDRARPSIAWWHEVDWWTCYLAEVDGQPAAAGMLEVLDGVGYLAAACTIEAARGKGCQSALIARRIQDAAAAACDVVCVETGYATQSQKNQERYGFRLAATAAEWSSPATGRQPARE